MASNEDRTRVYAALILQDDEVAITSDKISTPLKAAKVYFEPCWPDLFAKALDGVDVKNMIISLSSGTGSGGPAADPRIRKLSPVQVLHAFKESSSSRIHHHGQALLFIFIAYTLFNDTKWSSSSSTSTPSRSQVLRRRLHRLHDAQLHDKESTKSKPSFPRHVLYFPFPFLIFTTFRVAILVPTFPFHVYSFLSPVPPFRCIPLASACPYKTMEREKVHGPPQGLDTTRNGCETTTTTRIGCEGRMRQESPRRALQVKPHDEAKLVKYVLYEGRMSARRSTSLHQANETRSQAHLPVKSSNSTFWKEGCMLERNSSTPSLTRGHARYKIAHKLAHRPSRIPNKYVYVKEGCCFNVADDVYSGGCRVGLSPCSPSPEAPFGKSTPRYRRRRRGARPRKAGRPKKRALSRVSRGFLGGIPHPVAARFPR